MMEDSQSPEELMKLQVVEFSIGSVDDGAKFKCNLFKSSTTESQKRKMVCESSHMKYDGSNFDYNPSRQHLKQYIAIVNKKTGEKHFYDADVFKMYPMMKREDDVDSEEERQEAMRKVQDETRTFIERQDNLTEIFGSNKRQKAMAARQRNKVSDSTEAVKSAVESVILHEGIVEGQIAGEQSLSILPYNKEATSEDEVYALEKYVPGVLRNSVAEIAQELLNPSAKQINDWKEKKDPRGCRYISWHSTHAHPSVRNDPDTHEEYACCLHILSYYIKMHAPTGSVPEKEKYIEAMSPTAKSWLLQEFTPEYKSFSLKTRLPTRLKDKILCYAVVLCWHIDSCQFDVQMLAEAFSVSERKISTVVRALGGQTQVMKSGGLRRSTGVLKLPLSFPTPGKKGRAY